MAIDDDSSIPFCAAICEDADVIDRGCCIIEEYVDGGKVDAARINDELTALQFFRERLDQLEENLVAIRDGQLSRKKAKELK